eukprot:GHVP01038854.1.p1 GENE.GHVP01038854.1~~GHVP01038854.1.p1  ORF type:complete len:156 (+),score=18.15 GHVP01038854.1:26-469(+)
MEFFGKLSEELTNTFVRPHSNLFESDKEESGGVDFRADSPDYDEEDSPVPDGVGFQNMKLLFDRLKWTDLQNRSKENFKLVENGASILLYLYPAGCACDAHCSCPRVIFGLLSQTALVGDVVTYNGESKSKNQVYSELRNWLNSPQS